MSKIAVIGAGSWGTAISNLLVAQGHDITLWARDPFIVKSIEARRHNPRYLRDIELSRDLKVTSDLARAVTEKDVIAIAVPSQAMRTTINEIADNLNGSPIIVSFTKGLETTTLLRMSQVISASVPEAQVAVLSGPNHAEEVGKNIPSATVVTSNDPKISFHLQEIFMAASLRVYTNQDIVGVEMAAATKNVIAIAVGISDGLGYGDNGRAALMTRGLAEMTRLGVAMGAKPMTFAGLAGIGDLIATCTSRYSRNRAVGARLVKGQSVDEAQAEMGMVAEGIKTVEAVCALAARNNLETPISQSVYDVIYLGKKPSDCVQELMTRGPTEEELQ